MFDNSYFILRWEIDNAAATLATGKAESRVFNEGGFKWKIGIQPEPNIPGTIYFALSCVHQRGGKWRCEVNVEFLEPVDRCEELMIFDDGKQTSDSVYYFQLSKFTDLGGEYNINGKVIIEFGVNITTSECIDLSKFSSPNEICNVTLMIGENKVKVSKDMLSTHSPVFAEMFCGGFAGKGKREVEIKDVVYEDFLDLLNLIYLGTTKITDRTVRHILKLAHQFEMERVMNIADEHLRQSSGLSAAKKLLLADQYGLTDLRDQCLQSFTSVNEMQQALMSSAEFVDYSDGMKARICERMMKLKPQ